MPLKTKQLCLLACLFVAGCSEPNTSETYVDPAAGAEYTGATGDYEAGIEAAFAGDYDTALAEFTIAAEAGLDLAQYNLGILYYTGQGVEQDLGQAYTWTRAAAEQGHVGAQANLAILYFEGSGVNRSFERGLEWYQTAAWNGHGDSALGLATMYLDGDRVDRDLVTAHAWANQAVYNEHLDAESLLSDITARMADDELAEARRLFARWQINQ